MTLTWSLTEQRVAQVQIGVDEADAVRGLAQLRHDASHVSGHPGESAPQVIRQKLPHIGRPDSAVDHRVAEAAESTLRP
jgi:hypothetical protein